MTPRSFKNERHKIIIQLMDPVYLKKKELDDIVETRIELRRRIRVLIFELALSPEARLKRRI